MGAHSFIHTSEVIIPGTMSIISTSPADADKTCSAPPPAYACAPSIPTATRASTADAAAAAPPVLPPPDSSELRCSVQRLEEQRAADHAALQRVDDAVVELRPTTCAVKSP